MGHRVPRHCRTRTFVCATTGMVALAVGAASCSSSDKDPASTSPEVTVGPSVPTDEFGLPVVSESDDWPARGAFPADPDDPEPFGSTGSELTDLIRVEDESAFACVAYLGVGPEEILSPDKSGYEAVPDAHLFVANFTDGTSVDIRVHPEVGDAVAAGEEVERYLRPLGQLPTVLRRDIGRFAIRRGSETATASHLEGISVQTENMDVRESTDRMEETLFHEAVHTAFDARFGYGRSEAWLAAQEADGRFIAEYARENPDTEDLPESLLYVYTYLHHPDRLSDELAAAVRDRIPNRLAFFEPFFPVGESIFRPVGEEVPCPPSVDPGAFADDRSGGTEAP